ncbi:hypothetical protein ACFQZ8_18955, partial [Micromonospora azadirachtae]
RPAWSCPARRGRAVPGLGALGLVLSGPVLFGPARLDSRLIIPEFHEVGVSGRRGYPDFLEDELT